MIAFSLLISKGSPQLCVWKVFQDTLFPGGSKSYAVLSWEALPDHKAKPDFYSCGFSFKLGVIAATSVSLPTPSQLSLRDLACGLCINNSGKAQILAKM